MQYQWGTTPSNSFTCYRCHGVFQKGWSDNEASAELDERLGNAPADYDRGEVGVLCDPCAEAFLEWAHATGQMKDGKFVFASDQPSDARGPDHG